MENIKSIYYFIKAFAIYKLKSITPDYGFQSLRKLFVATNGRLNDVLSRIIAWTTPQIQELSAPGFLGITLEEEESAVAMLKQNGIYQFEARLKETYVEEIIDYASKEECRYLIVPKNSKGKTRIQFSSKLVRYDPKKIRAPKYTFSMKQAMAHPRLQQIIFDNSLFRIAQSYFGSRPILDLTAMWWSTSFNARGAAEAAQMYHFDLDRIKFIKFFFYLTDVDENNGPFCYVKNSHKRLPAPIREDRRLSDDEVGQYYSADDMVEVVGKKGTILAADTRGLHKGKPVVEGHRLLFQIEFCNSYFGVEYPKIENVEFLPEVQDKIQKYPEVYTRILK